MAHNAQTVCFTEVILKRKVNFQDVSPTRKLFCCQSRQLFIAKSDLNLKCVASERVKTWKFDRGGQTVHPTGGILKRQVAFQDLSHTRKVSHH